jgi:hypothetical protein
VRIAAIEVTYNFTEVSKIIEVFDVGKKIRIILAIFTKPLKIKKELQKWWEEDKECRCDTLTYVL